MKILLFFRKFVCCFQYFNMKESNKHKIFVALFMAFSFVLTVSAQANLSALIPMPNKVEPLEGKPYRFVEGRTAIAYGGEELHFVAETLADVIQHRTGIAVPLVSKCCTSRHCTCHRLRPDR